MKCNENAFTAPIERRSNAPTVQVKDASKALTGRW